MKNERPKYHEDETLDRAVEKIIPSVLAWLNDGSTAEDIKDDLRDAIDSHSDGYDICRALENRHHWAVNAGLVDVMDGASHCKYMALNEREKEWVVAEGIKPKYGEGDTVSFSYKDEVCSGKISRVEADIGKYVVFCPQLGHVETGTGTHGIYVEFEEPECDSGK